MKNFHALAILAKALSGQTLGYSPIFRSSPKNRSKAVPVRNSATDPKIHRNEPCPCGSGNKYKRCCINQ